jgi:hypothetical protein
MYLNPRYLWIELDPEIMVAHIIARLKGRDSDFGDAFGWAEEEANPQQEALGNDGA